MLEYPGQFTEKRYVFEFQLAMAMEPLLNSEDNQLDSQDNRYFEALADPNTTPSTWQEIIRDPNVSSLIKALKSADNVFSDDDEFVGNYLSLRQNSSRFNPAVGKTIDDFRGTEDLKKFDIFAKRMTSVGIPVKIREKAAGDRYPYPMTGFEYMAGIQHILADSELINFSWRKQLRLRLRLTISCPDNTR